MMAQHTSFSYPYPQDDGYYDQTQQVVSPLRHSPWKNRELPGLAPSFRQSPGGLGIYSDNRQTTVAHSVPQLSIHRASPGPGLDAVRLSPLSPRNLGPHHTDPLSNWYTNKEEPWSSVRTQPDPQIHTMGTNIAQYATPIPSTGNYRHGPSSIESSSTGHTQSDSGYGTAYTYSTPGMDSIDRSQEIQEVSADINGFQIHSRHSGYLASDRGSDGHYDPRDTRSTSRTRRPSQRRSAPEKCPVPGCNEISKCPSDAKKHRLKHDKPYVCEVPGCKRTPGFTTVNDLNRHKKSVHKIGGATKSFKCVAAHCKNKDKEWPRLDNFKQHVVRMHQDEDLDDIIRRSECRRGDRSRSRTPHASPAPALDKTLAGMDDMSKHLPLDSPSTMFSPDLGKNWDPNTANPFDTAYSGRRNASSYQPYEGGQGYGQNYAVEMSYKVSPPRMELAVPASSLESPSSAGLNALAAVAATVEENESDTHENQVPDVGNRSGVLRLPEPTSHICCPNNTHSGQAKPEPETMARLNPLARAIAEGILSSKAGADEPLEQRILRVLTRAADASSSSSALPSSVPNPLSLPSIQSGSLSSPTSSAIDKSIQPPLPALVLPPPTPLTAPELAPKTNKTIQCSRCPSHFARACDLRKHERRHMRPYCCTYPKCHKSFGSKSDWKRHENSQHFQNEVWRCEIGADGSFPKACHFDEEKESVRGTEGRDGKRPRKETISDPMLVCGLLFHTRNSYLLHLGSSHGLPVSSSTVAPFSPPRSSSSVPTPTIPSASSSFLPNPHLSPISPHSDLPPRIQILLNITRIGRNGQSRFWCGFCRTIIPLKTKRAAAWDERFNHIDHHFMREGRRVGDTEGDEREDLKEGKGGWWCVEERRIKTARNPREDFGDADDDVADAEDDVEGDADSDVEYLEGNIEPSLLMPTAHRKTRKRPHTSEPRSAYPPGLKHKRTRMDMLLSHKDSSTDIITFCCRCGHGPCSHRLYSNCMGCEHTFCRDCERVEAGGE